MKKEVVIVIEEEDDDCVILEGDPDAPTVIPNVSEADSDDIIVVCEKGKVACRDYPHPRHLCAVFPFASTLHVEYCDQCYCCVCDSVAPCSSWGTGIFKIDHCNATGRDHSWKNKRKYAKHDGKESAAVPQLATNATAQHLLTPALGKSAPVPQPATNSTAQHLLTSLLRKPASVPPQSATISTTQQLQTQSSEYASATNIEPSFPCYSYVPYGSQCNPNLPYSLPYYGYGRQYPMSLPYCASGYRPQYSPQSLPYNRYPSQSYRDPPYR